MKNKMATPEEIRALYDEFCENLSKRFDRAMIEGEHKVPISIYDADTNNVRWHGHAVLTGTGVSRDQLVDDVWQLWLDLVINYNNGQPLSIETDAVVGYKVASEDVNN